MGKSNKGKELGEGISQRKDGMYIARFRYGNGQRQQKVFRKLNDAKQWLLDRKFQFSHHVPQALKVNCSEFTNITVDEWFGFWNEAYNQTRLLIRSGTTARDLQGILLLILVILRCLMSD